MVSPLAFGTGSLHHSFSHARRYRLLETAFEHGITHFDTSPYYGAGIAETDIGIALHKCRDRITIASKIGLYPAGGEVSGSIGIRMRKLLAKLHLHSDTPIIDWDDKIAEESLNATLHRCQTDYLDILFLHEPCVVGSEKDIIIEWVQRQKDLGKIRYWGIAGSRSSVEPWVIQDCSSPPIIQTRDSLCRREADFLFSSGRVLQFTYGYLRPNSTATAYEILLKALRRNSTGAIILSTRCPKRLTTMAKALISS